MLIKFTFLTFSFSVHSNYLTFSRKSGKFYHRFYRIGWRKSGSEKLIFMNILFPDLSNFIICVNDNLLLLPPPHFFHSSITKNLFHSFPSFMCFQPSRLRATFLYLPSVLSLLTSFLPSFFLSSFLPFYLPSFPPSFLVWLLFFLVPSFLLSFLCFLAALITSFYLTIKSQHSYIIEQLNPCYDIKLLLSSFIFYFYFHFCKWGKVLIIFMNKRDLNFSLLYENHENIKR